MLLGDRYKQLCEFYAKYGHCKVTRQVRDENGEIDMNIRSLGEWVSDQRKYFRQKKSKTLTPERIDMMNNIRFMWNPETYQKTFQMRVEECKKFKALYGHLTVPSYDTLVDGKYPTEDEKRFRLWTQSIRHQYKRRVVHHINNKLDKAKIKALDDIGFDWGDNRSHGGSYIGDDSKSSSNSNNIMNISSNNNKVSTSLSFRNTYYRMKRHNYHHHHTPSLQFKRKRQQSSNYLNHNITDSNQYQEQQQPQQTYTPDYTHQIIVPTETSSRTRNQNRSRFVQQSSSSSIRSRGCRPTSLLDLDQQQYRFFLIGTCTGNNNSNSNTSTTTISIFDLSSWGSISSTSSQYTTTINKHQQQQKYRRYEPIQKAKLPTKPLSSAQQTRVSSTSTVTRNQYFLPGTLIATKWFPYDSGAFITVTQSTSSLSSSSSSYNTNDDMLDCIYLWDTNEMKPIVGFHPYKYETTTVTNNNNNIIPLVSCFNFTSSTTTAASTSITPIAAVTSKQSNLIKLIDFRTVSSSQSYQSNIVSSKTGYTTVQFSNTNPYLMATGTTKIGRTNNSMIVLWDIRKSGSLSCLSVLDENYIPVNKTLSNEYMSNGQHWNNIKRIQLYEQQKDQSTIINKFLKNQYKMSMSSSQLDHQQQKVLPPKSNSTSSSNNIRARLQNLSSQKNNNKNKQTRKRKLVDNEEETRRKNHSSSFPNNRTSPNNYNSVMISLSSSSGNDIASTAATVSSSQSYSHHDCATGITQVQFHPSSGQYLISTADCYCLDSGYDNNNSINNCSNTTDMIKVWDLRTAGHWIKSCRFRLPVLHRSNNNNNNGSTIDNQQHLPTNSLLGPMIIVDNYYNRNNICNLLSQSDETFQISTIKSTNMPLLIGLLRPALIAIASIVSLKIFATIHDDKINRIGMGIFRDLGRYKAKKRRNMSSKGLISTIMQKDDVNEDMKLILDAENEDQSNCHTD